MEGGRPAAAAAAEPPLLRMRTIADAFAETAKNVDVMSTLSTLARLRLAHLAPKRHLSSGNTKKVCTQPINPPMVAICKHRGVCLVLQIPRRRGEYLYGVAPCLAALHTGRRQIYSIFLKSAVGTRTSELKRFAALTYAFLPTAIIPFCFSTALSEVKRYAERRRMEIHFVSKETLERMSSKRPHQVKNIL